MCVCEGTGEGVGFKEGHAKNNGLNGMDAVYSYITLFMPFIVMQKFYRNGWNGISEVGET